LRELLAYTYADLREQFGTPKNCGTHCILGCARAASATDEWRSQGGLADGPRSRRRARSLAADASQGVSGSRVPARLAFAPARKFARLNNSSGSSALLRNFFVAAAAKLVGAISESVLSDFNGLRRDFRVVSFCFLPSWSPKPRPDFPKKCEGRLVMFLKNNDTRSNPALSRNWRFFVQAPARDPAPHPPRKGKAERQDQPSPM
jgi:hypothetical protein